MSLTTRAGVAALLLVVLTGGRVVFAQFRDEDEPEAEQPAQQQLGFVVLNEANLCQWALGVNSPDAARARLEASLAITVDDVDRACGLSDEQKKKLKLAGRGDLKRIWDLVDESVRKYANVQISQDEMTRIHRELQSVRVAIGGNLFEGGTFFAKTLAGMLTPDQLARVEKSNAERAVYRHRARIELVVATLDQVAGFSDSQRQRLVTLIVSETKVPTKTTQYDYQLLLVQLARLPEEKVRAIVDELQWRLLRPKLEQGLRLEPFLIQNGVLPGPAGNAPAPPAAPAVIRRVLK